MYVVVFASFFTLTMGDQASYEYIVRKNAKNYNDALTGCSSINASLVVIKNEAQNKLILRQVQEFQENVMKESSLDLIFVLDGSGSVGKTNFILSKEWIKNVSSYFDLENNSTHIGVVEYSNYNNRLPFFNQSEIVVEIQLGKIRSRSTFNEKVDTIEYYRGSTHTVEALNRTLFEFRNSTRFAKPTNSKVLVLITDGKPTESNNLPDIAKDLRSNGIIVITVEINPDSLGLEQLETKIGLNSSIYRIGNYTELPLITSRIVHAIKQVAFADPLFWIGLQRNLSNNNFTWVDGSHPNFNQWADKQPTNNRNKSCVVLNHYCCNSSYKWVNVECNGNFKETTKPPSYICQKEKEMKIVPTQSYNNPTTFLLNSSLYLNFTKAGFTKKNFCRTNKISYKGTEYTFSKANFYDTATSEEICNFTGSPKATIRCVSKIDSETNGIQALFDLSTLKEVSCNMTLKNLKEISSGGLSQLFVLTANTRNLTDEDREKAIEYLEDFVKEANIPIREEELKVAVSTVGNLLDKNDNQKKTVNEENTRLVEVVSNFTSRLSLSNRTLSFNHKTRNINLQIKRIHANKFSNSNVIPFNLSNGFNNNSQSSVLINIASSSFNQKFAENNFVFALLVNTIVLNESNAKTSQVIVIGTSNSSFSDIQASITFENQTIPTPEEINKENTVLRTLNRVDMITLKKNKWVICRECHKKSSTPPIYQVGKFGSFSLLFSSTTVRSIVALTIVSYIGIGISTIFFIATITIYLRFRYCLGKKNLPTICEANYM